MGMIVFSDALHVEMRESHTAQWLKAFESLRK